MQEIHNKKKPLNILNSTNRWYVTEGLWLVHYILGLKSTKSIFLHYCQTRRMLPFCCGYSSLTERPIDKTIIRHTYWCGKTGEETFRFYWTYNFHDTQHQ